MLTLYVILTVVLGVLILVDATALTCPIYLVYRNVHANNPVEKLDADGKPKSNKVAGVESPLASATIIAVSLIVGEIVLSVALGFFALNLYFMLETIFQPPPKLPRLEDLPRDLEMAEQESDDEFVDSDIAEAMEDASSPLKRMERSNLGITSKLVFEASKFALSVDRVRMCEKFIQKIPPSTRIPKFEVDDVLRLFDDVDDGLKILLLFEPYMDTKNPSDGRKSAHASSPSRKSTKPTDDKGDSARKSRRSGRKLNADRSKSNKSHRSNKSSKSSKSEKSEMPSKPARRHSARSAAHQKSASNAKRKKSTATNKSSKKKR